MTADKATIFGTETMLCLSTSGHYCLDIHPDEIPPVADGGKMDEVLMLKNGESQDLPTIQSDYDISDVNEILVLEKELTPTQQRNQIVKIHKQFGHATAQNLKKLITNAGINDSQLLKLVDNVVENCDRCDRYKKPPARPVVGFSKADDFNQIV